MITSTAIYRLSLSSSVKLWFRCVDPLWDAYAWTFKYLLPTCLQVFLSRNYTLLLFLDRHENNFWSINFDKGANDTGFECLNSSIFSDGFEFLKIEIFLIRTSFYLHFFKWEISTSSGIILEWMIENNILPEGYLHNHTKIRF